MAGELLTLTGIGRYLNVSTGTSAKVAKGSNLSLCRPADTRATGRTTDERCS
jgi:hypothetical protein